MTHILTKRIFSSAIGILALVGILVGINFFAKMLYVRKDITADKLYSLSQGTRNIVGKLPEDVTIKLFYSASMADQGAVIRAYADRVKDLLREYENNAGRAISVEVIDPKPDSDEEEWAQKYGVAGQPASMDEMFFFGLVVEAVDRHQVIPFLAPEREQFLEYDLTRMIWQVAYPGKKTVGILSSLPVMGMEPPPMMMMMQQQQGAQPPWVFVNELRKSYQVVAVTTNEPSISTNIDVLIVIHPRNLPESTLFAIDQYVLRGGRLMVFTDPACTVAAEDMGYGMRMPSKSSLNELLGPWGAQMPDGKVVVDMDNPTQLGDGRGRAEDNPAWITVTERMLNKDDIVTAPLNIMVLPAAGHFVTTRVTNSLAPLVSSSVNSMEKDGMAAMGGMMAQKPGFQPSRVPLVLAAKLSGVFQSAFPSGIAGKTNGILSVATGPNTVFLVGDADLLADENNFRKIPLMGTVVYQPFNNNMDFVLSAVDQMCGDENLISLRSRAKFERPFTVVKELERQAQERWLGTEQQLNEQYQQLNQQLQALQSKKDEAQRSILSEEQKAKIEEFRARQIEMRRELREVRKNLRREIDVLGVKIKVINILVVPLVVCAAGIGLALYRHYKVKTS